MMKSISFSFKVLLLFSFLFLFLNQVSPQQAYSTIHVVSKNIPDDNVAVKIYMNNRYISAITEDENISYKIYSEGRVGVDFIFDLVRLTRALDVKMGTAYYFEINYFNQDAELVGLDDGRKLFDKNTKTLTLEEDPLDPIGELPEDSEFKYGQATCFAVHPSGYLVTNQHVVKDNKRVDIFVNNDTISAEVVGVDNDLDLALLKSDSAALGLDGLAYGFLNTSSRQDQESFVIGYPLVKYMGEEAKVTDGIIGSLTGYKGSTSQYQFSAPVQPGNSGGPLFNTNGQVIGVVNAKLSGAEGAGYAIKSQYLLTFLELMDVPELTAPEKSLSELSLPDQVEVLKEFVFVVRTE